MVEGSTASVSASGRGRLDGRADIVMYDSQLDVIDASRIRYLTAECA